MNDPEKDDKPEPVKLAVCVNHRYGVDRPSCGARGSEALATAIEAALLAEGLNFEVERFMCFGRCGRGPTMRFIPGGDFHFEVTEADIPELIRSIKDHYSQNEPDAEKKLPVNLLGS